MSSLVFALVIAAEDELCRPLFTPFRFYFTSSTSFFYLAKNQFVLFSAKSTWFIRGTKRVHETATIGDDDTKLFMYRKCSGVECAVAKDN